MADATDRLEVKVLEARGLSYGGSRPNSYVEIVIGPDKRRTIMIPEDDTPKWKTKPYIFNNVLGSNIDTMVVNVLHRDNFTGLEDDLGRAIIPTHTFFGAPKVEISNWFRLTATERMIPEEDGVEQETEIGEIKLGRYFIFFHFVCF